ncbi:MAG: CHAD domain-containing protein [Deltaproteobacteria bacterium]|nr:CHAD domain-containing protein [Deltaproteobacteria bacterium]
MNHQAQKLRHGGENESAVSSEPDRIAAIPKELRKLLRKRGRNLPTMVAKINGADDPELIHKSRVNLRRLQQYLPALFPKPQPKTVRKLRRTSRQVRKLLGEWRNHDIMIAQALEQEQKARNREKREAWRALRQFLIQGKAHQAALARRKLSKYDPAGFAYMMEEILGDSRDPDANQLSGHLKARIQRAEDQWKAALNQAEQSLDNTDIHSFRVATKRLRYRLELAHEVGAVPSKSQIRRLEKLQEALGQWHDRQVLQETITQALTRPDFQPGDLAVSRTLVNDLEKGRKAHQRNLKKIFELAREC